MFRRFAVILSAACLCLPSPAATRVALVSAGGRPEIQNLQDIALALLSKDTTLEMVERTEIDRVLREQSLSLGGADDAIAAVQSGKLLHTDLFAVLESSVLFSFASNQPLALVVFDARTGVRYADAVLAASNTAPSASAVAEALQAAVAKSRQPAGQLHTVCLLLVRNADLPAQYDRLCDSAGLLLERELTALPNVVVLERGRLAHVHQEQQITGDENQLLSSLQLLELDVSRDGNGLKGILAVATADGGRTNKTEATVPSRDAAALARTLAARAKSLLGGSVSRLAQQDRIAEAKKFHDEMLLLQNQQDYLGALRAMESAYALAPDQPGYGVDLVVCLCDGATEYFAPGSERGLSNRKVGDFTVDMPTALYLGNRAFDLFTDMCRQVIATNQPGDPVPNFMQYFTGRIQLRGLLGNLAGHTNSMDESARAGMLALIHKDLALMLDVQEPFWRARATNAASLAAYAGQSTVWLSSSGHERLATQEWQDYKALLSRRLDETTRRVNSANGVTNSPSLTDLDDGSPASVERLQLLLQDPDPLVSLKARVALVAIKNPGPVTDEKITAFRQLRLQIQDELDHGFAQDPGPLRDAVWRQLEDALVKNIGTGPRAADEDAELCRFELARNVANVNFLRQVILSQAGALHDPQRLALVDAALQVMTNQVEIQSATVASPAVPRGIQTNVAAANQQRARAIVEFQSLHKYFTDKAALRPASVWKQAAPLLDLDRPVNGFHWLYRPVIDNGNAYAAALGHEDLGCPEDILQLWRIPLDGGPVEHLTHTNPAAFLMEVAGTGTPIRKAVAMYIKDPKSTYSDPRVTVAANFHDLVTNMASLWQPFRASAACFAGNRYFLGTSTYGIFVFSLNKDAAVERLCTTNGLPADNISALAFLESKLYIAAGSGSSGYLISYEPESHKLETLASSRRSEHLSPFDDQPSFSPFYIEADASRHRLILGADVASFSGPLSGFWSYTPENRQFSLFPTRDLPPPPELSQNDWSGRLDAQTAGVVHYSNSVAGLYDQPNRISFFYSVPSEGTNRTVWQAIGYNGHPPTAIPQRLLPIDGWLWSDRYSRRLSLDLARSENFSDLRPEYRFRPSQVVQPLADGKRVLMADDFSVWLLDLADVTAPRPGP